MVPLPCISAYIGECLISVYIGVCLISVWIIGGCIVSVYFGRYFVELSRRDFRDPSLSEQKVSGGTLDVPGRKSTVDFEGYFNSHAVDLLGYVDLLGFGECFTRC